MLRRFDRLEEWAHAYYDYKEREYANIYKSHKNYVIKYISTHKRLKEMIDICKLGSMFSLGTSLTIFIFSLIVFLLKFYYPKFMLFFSEFFFTDWITIWLLILVSATFVMCSLWSVYTINSKSKNTSFLSLLVLEIILLLSFSSNNLIIFFICFELSLIPMYLLICNDGSRNRKLRANYYLAIYTLFSGITLLVAIFNAYVELGSLNFSYIKYISSGDQSRLNCVWLLFFISFMGKIPVFPLHIWLPEAHVEASTVGSVILAALMLKLGLYGIIRLNLSISSSLVFFRPLVYSLSIVSIFYSSLVSLRQLDLKRVIAYSSVVHMNIALLGLISGTSQGVQGGILLIISHGVISSLLFFLVGALYDRVHTKVIFYYSGLCVTMPLFTTLLFMGSFANISFPLTFSFIGEILVFTGIFNISSFLGIIVVISTVVSSMVSIWLLNRVAFGSLKLKYYNIKRINIIDLSHREAYVGIFLVVAIVFFGIKPDVILTTL